MAQILVIDDDASFLGFVAETLRHAGHTVIVAVNGKQGLICFQTSGANLVITDLVMPEAEGLEVLTALRTVQPPVKVIAMSGGPSGRSEDYLKIATLLGAAMVLAKPFSVAALLQAVNEVLE